MANWKMASIQVALLFIVHLVSVASQETKTVDTRPQEAQAQVKRELCSAGRGDTEAGCPYWRTLGYCEPEKRYLDFMEKTCPVTCGFCEARPTVPPEARIVRVDVYSCLRSHNEKRAMHGARPLRWDWDLARDAEKWALELANKDLFEHSPWNGQGENLYSITRVEDGPITCEDAVQAWYDEVEDYPFDSPPRSVNGVKGKVIGHFTQLVWKSSKKLGVAVSYIKRGLWYSTYVVARYTPPGNHNGQFGSMVGRLRG